MEQCIQISCIIHTTAPSKFVFKSEVQFLPHVTITKAAIPITEQCLFTDCLYCILIFVVGRQ